MKFPMGRKNVKFGSILFSPKKSRCRDCGVSSDTIRLFHCNNFSHKFCFNCWNDFFHDNSPDDKLKSKTLELWEYDVNVVLM